MPLLLLLAAQPVQSLSVCTRVHFMYVISCPPRSFVSALTAFLRTILNQRYREHIHYIRKYYPQSAYAQHILQNLHEYRSITDTISLLKPIHKTSMLIPCEQLFIQTFQHNRNLIRKQSTGEQNPLFQLAINTMLMSATTRKQKQINSHNTLKSVPR
jgi:hypothetical protein